jgi:hypothetical protein
VPGADVRRGGAGRRRRLRCEARQQGVWEVGRGGKVVVWDGAEAVRGGAGARCCGLGGVRRGVLGREVAAQEEGSLPSALIVVIVGG